MRYLADRRTSDMTADPLPWIKAPDPLDVNTFRALQTTRARTGELAMYMELIAQCFVDLAIRATARHARQIRRLALGYLLGDFPTKCPSFADLCDQFGFDVGMLRNEARRLYALHEPADRARHAARQAAEAERERVRLERVALAEKHRQQRLERESARREKREAEKAERERVLMAMADKSSGGGVEWESKRES